MAHGETVRRNRLTTNACAPFEDESAVQPPASNDRHKSKTAAFLEFRAIVLAPNDLRLETHGAMARALETDETMPNGCCCTS